MKLPTFSGSLLIIFIVVFTPKAEAAVKSPQERVLQSKSGHVEKIVGGDPASIGQFPYMGGLVYEYGQYCGCVIMNQRWALTAAHCDIWSTDWVVVGTNYIEVNKNAGVEKYDPGHQKIYIKTVIRHPAYNPDTYDNDIALLLLEDPIAYTGYVKSIPYPRNYALSGGSDVLMSGWGAKQYGAEYSTSLRYVDLKIVNENDCKAYYGNNAIYKSMMCANGTGKDSCQGDGGGPLVCKIGNYFELVGLSSWGYGCAQPGYPGVYTKAGDFYDWIKSYVNPS